MKLDDDEKLEDLKTILRYLVNCLESLPPHIETPEVSSYNENDIINSNLSLRWQKERNIFAIQLNIIDSSLYLHYYGIIKDKRIDVEFPYYDQRNWDKMISILTKYFSKINGEKK